MKLLMEAEMQTAAFLNEIGFIDALYKDNSLQACEAYLEKMLSE